MIHVTEGSRQQVSGRRLLAALGSGAGSAAALGTVTYFALHSILPGLNQGLLTQLIVLEVYLILIAALRIAFGPLQGDPVALRFSSWRDVGLACIAWLLVIGLVALGYLMISPLTGGFMNAVRSVVSVGTDAKHLQGQPLSQWYVAIIRGCLVVPIFEETLFRGLFLQWLKRYMRSYAAVAVMALLFAAMHVYPVLMLYAFVYGLVAGALREKPVLRSTPSLFT
jgi:hypothetical protein